MYLNTDLSGKLYIKMRFETEQKIHAHLNVLNVLQKYTLTNGSIMARHAELANLSDYAANYWNQAAQEAIAVGDVHSYTISQQRILNIIDVADMPEKENLKLSIHEQVGKMNYRINPNEAVKYLSNAVLIREKSNDIVNIIELSGFLSKSCELIGNYTSSIECADKALAAINIEEMPLECALLNYAKLEPLYNLGKLEELNNLAQNDIIPILNDAISKKRTIAGLSLNDLNYIETDTKLIFVKSLVTQGRVEVLSAVKSITVRANELGIAKFDLEIRLIEALYNTLQGNEKLAASILEYLRDSIPKNNDYLMLRWHTINLLNNILNGKFDIDNPDTNNALILAEKFSDFNLHTLIRSFLGKIFKENNSPEKARQIYHGLVNYCSQNKMATGALLNWYLIAELEVAEANIENAQSIAERALEVAKNAGINNYLFMALIQKLLAEINIIKGDFESARIFTEQALSLAEKLGLHLIQSQLFLTYGKIFQEIAAVTGEDKENNVQNAYKLYMKALEISQNIDNEFMTIQIEKELTSLSTFCQLSGIRL